MASKPYDKDSANATFGQRGQSLFEELLYESMDRLHMDGKLIDVRAQLRTAFYFPERDFILNCLEKVAGDWLFLYGGHRAFIEVCSTKQQGDYMWLGKSKLELCNSDYMALMAFTEDGEKLRTVQLVKTRSVKAYADVYVKEHGWKNFGNEDEDVAQVRQFFNKGLTVDSFLESLRSDQR